MLTSCRSQATGTKNITSFAPSLGTPVADPSDTLRPSPASSRATNNTWMEGEADISSLAVVIRILCNVIGQQNLLVFVSFDKCTCQINNIHFPWTQALRNDKITIIKCLINCSRCNEWELGTEITHQNIIRQVLITKFKFFNATFLIHVIQVL